MSDERKLPEGWGTQRGIPDAWKNKSNVNPWEEKKEDPFKKEVPQLEIKSQPIKATEKTQEISVQEKKTQVYVQTDETRVKESESKGEEVDNKETENIALPETETKHKKFNLKPLVFVVVVLILLLLIGALVLKIFGDKNTVNNKPDYSTDKNEQTETEFDTETESEAESEIDTEVETETESASGSEEYPEDTQTESETGDVSTENSNEDLDLISYVGFWNIKGRTDEELSILHIEDGLLEFSLWYYRLNSVQYVTAILEGNVAKFDWVDELGYKFKGELIFKDNSITVNIVESDLIYIEPSITIYDEKHEQWYTGLDNSGLDIEFPDYSADDETATDDEINDDEDNSLDNENNSVSNITYDSSVNWLDYEGTWSSESVKHIHGEEECKM